MAQRCTHPGGVERSELRIRHLTAGHGELSVVAFGDMTADGDIIRFVGEDAQTSRSMPFIGERNFNRIEIGADDAFRGTRLLYFRNELNRTGHGKRAGSVDSTNFRVRMGRALENAPGLSGDIHVIDVAACAAQ